MQTRKYIYVSYQELSHTDRLTDIYTFIDTDKQKTKVKKTPAERQHIRERHGNERDERTNTLMIYRRETSPIC